MRVTVDFDGVLAESWSASELEGLDEHVLLLSTLSIDAARPRPGVISVVAFLSTFATVEILSTRPTAQATSISTWLGEHIPQLAGAPIHSRATELKSEFCAGEGIVLHIDDDARACQPKGPRCIVWVEQTTKELLREVTTTLAPLLDLRMAGEPVRRLEELPSHSSTPVYRVVTPTATLKLRVVEDPAQSRMLAQIHAVAAREPQLRKMLGPEREGSSAGIHLTEFVPGDTLAISQSRDDASEVANRVGRWLARLHDATTRPDGACLVSCACDAFNLCIDDRGKARIIDAGDACWGARWIDLVWSEQLLGPWIDGAEKLIEAYMDVASSRPTHDDVTRAVAGYYFRLHSVLRSAISSRLKDAADREALEAVRRRRAVPPDDSILRKWAT